MSLRLPSHITAQLRAERAKQFEALFIIYSTSDASHALISARCICPSCARFTVVTLASALQQFAKDNDIVLSDVLSSESHSVH